MNRDHTDHGLDKNRAFTYPRCRQFEHIIFLSQLKPLKNVTDSRKFWGILMHELYACRQRGRVVKSVVIVINMFSVQNLLAPCFCVLRKKFLLLDGLGKQF